MDTAQINKLLKKAAKEEQIQLKILSNAVITTMKKYKDDSTATRYKDWQTADAALNEYISRLEGQYYPQEQTFPNLLTVLAHLENTGWQISRAGLYKHRKEGKLSPQKDGIYRLKDVEKYAKTWLRLKSTGKKLREEQEDLQRKKLEREIEKLEEEIARNRYKREIEEGKYILRERLEMELAARAAVLDAGLEHMNQSKAVEWINIVDGDKKKARELIAALSVAKNELLNQYATTQEFQVVLEGVLEED
jgi:hypothetical protein